MADVIRSLLPTWRLAAAALVAVALAAPAMAAKTGPTATAAPMMGWLTDPVQPGVSLFRWEAPFSLWRCVIFIAGTGLVWFLSFDVLMLSSLGLDNPKPPRPKEAFARAAGWFVLFDAIAFVLVFALLTNDLYYTAWVPWFPHPLTALNFHFPWICVLVLGLCLMFLVRYLLRR